MGALGKKVVVLTGGCGFLGRAFAKSLLEADATVVLTDINEEVGNQVAGELGEAFPNRVKFEVLDITSKVDIQRVLMDVSSREGRIDGVVNNAYPRNKQYGRKFEDVEYGDFCENINTHLGGYFLMCQQFAEFFKKQTYGSIVNIASIYGVIAPRFEVYDGTPMTMPVEYAAIKSALIHLTKYIAKYYKGSQIRANCISPGGIFNHQPEAFVEKYNA
ncbi:MAG: NAD(P)-dependent dehydrogenase (short-subunit alcohol dehydrogenase family), partial [Candidatus Marinamargulisbacteria bacterium]